MKKFKVFTLAAAALVLGLTSCSKDNEGIKDVVEGEESSIQLALHFPKAPAATRGFDAGAKTGEADVKNVNLFIYFDNGGLYKVVNLLPSAFKPATAGVGADYYEMEAATKVSVPTGAKKFFVGINLTAPMIDKIKAVNGLKLSEVTVVFTQAELTTLASGLAMFSEVKDHTVVVSTDGLLNKLTFNAERLVSKVTVEYNSTALDLTGAGGAISDLKFGINNFNTKSFVAATAAFKDPNWATGSYVSGDFVDAVNYVEVLDINGITVTPDSYTPCYANENTSEDKEKQEITRATIRGKYVPTAQHTYDGINVTVVGVPTATPATFYACQKAAGATWYYFYNATEATNYNANEGGTIITYTDGYCYWNVYLNKTAGANQWDVVRNSSFSISLRSILGIGSKDSEIVGTVTEIPNEESNILFDINVRDWKPIPTQVEDLTQQ